MANDDSPSAIRKHLFSLHLEAAIPENVLPLIELRHYRPGEYLCRAGDAADYLWLIVEGRCKVMPVSEYGKAIVLSYLEPPGLNGDIELFNNYPFLYSVQAESRVVAIAIPRQVFFTEMMQHLAFVQFLCKRFASKIYKSSQRHSSAMLYPVRSRLTYYIVRQAEATGNPIILSTDETAQYLGVTARHLRRVLAELEEAGLILRKGNKITIVDLLGMKSQTAIQT